MSAEHYDWLTAAAKRAYRTVDATEVVIDAVERAEMDPEHAALDELGDLRDRIEKTLVAEPPLSFADGGVIAAGVNRDLDEVRELSRNSKQASPTQTRFVTIRKAMPSAVGRYCPGTIA